MKRVKITEVSNGYIVTTVVENRVPEETKLYTFGDDVLPEAEMLADISEFLMEEEDEVNF